MRNFLFVYVLCLTSISSNADYYDSEEKDRPISEIFSSKHQPDPPNSRGGIWFVPPPNYNSSPLNYENSGLNYENFPLNYKNSPLNYENSPMRYGNTRIIRDNSGNPLGYEVPKAGGGANYFDFNGNRIGYKPDDE
jgi:hypothetical protein